MALEKNAPGPVETKPQQKLIPLPQNLDKLIRGEVAKMVEKGLMHEIVVRTPRFDELRQKYGATVTAFLRALEKRYALPEIVFKIIPDKSSSTAETATHSTLRDTRPDMPAMPDGSSSPVSADSDPDISITQKGLEGPIKLQD